MIRYNQFHLFNDFLPNDGHWKTTAAPRTPVQFELAELWGGSAGQSGH